MVKQEMRDLKNIVSQFFKQSVRSEDVMQLAQGIELPGHTIYEIDDYEQRMLDVGDVRTNMVGVLN
jgi:hypothetical protein